MENQEILNTNDLQNDNNDLNSNQKEYDFEFILDSDFNCNEQVKVTIKLKNHPEFSINIFRTYKNSKTINEYLFEQLKVFYEILYDQLGNNFGTPFFEIEDNYTGGNIIGFFILNFISPDNEKENINKLIEFLNKNQFSRGKLTEIIMGKNFNKTPGKIYELFFRSINTQSKEILMLIFDKVIKIK